MVKHDKPFLIRFLVGNKLIVKLCRRSPKFDGFIGDIIDFRYDTEYNIKSFFRNFSKNMNDLNMTLGMNRLIISRIFNSTVPKRLIVKFLDKYSENVEFVIFGEYDKNIHFVESIDKKIVYSPCSGNQVIQIRIKFCEDMTEITQLHNFIAITVSPFIKVCDLLNISPYIAEKYCHKNIFDAHITTLTTEKCLNLDMDSEEGTLGLPIMGKVEEDEEEEEYEEEEVEELEEGEEFLDEEEGLGIHKKKMEQSDKEKEILDKINDLQAQMGSMSEGNEYNQAHEYMNSLREELKSLQNSNPIEEYHNDYKIQTNIFRE